MAIILVDAQLRKTYLEIFIISERLCLLLLRKYLQNHAEYQGSIDDGRLGGEEDHWIKTGAQQDLPGILGDDKSEDAHSAYFRNLKDDMDSTATMPHQDQERDIGCSAHGENREVDDVRKKSCSSTPNPNEVTEDFKDAIPQMPRNTDGEQKVSQNVLHKVKKDQRSRTL